MAISFSEYFKLSKHQHELDFVDIPINNGDLPLFIDPFSIHHRVDRWSVECHNTIVDYFQRVIKAIRANDASNAMELLSHLHEPNQTRLGLSRGRRPRGRGLGLVQVTKLLEALRRSRAIKTGLLRDLEDCVLLIEGIGSDKISDITTNIIRGQLIGYTQEQCELWKIPTQRVAAGSVWRGGSAGWLSVYGSLPVCHEAPVLLVPKAAVRMHSSFDSYEYYNKEVLEYLQAEHLNANTNLIRLLKSGERRPPTKKTLKNRRESEYSKDFLYTVSSRAPHLIRAYKQRKREELAAVADGELLQIAGRETEPLSRLAKQLTAIPSGDQAAGKYHDHIIGVLEAIFYPDLTNPKKEQEIDQGRKRVDIVFQNAAKDGFFNLLHRVKQIPSAYIYVECKNYATDVSNPELDQLLGRFQLNFGKFGILVSRTFENKELFHTRCRDNALAGRGFVIGLDDGDICHLLELRESQDQEGLERFLDERLRRIVL